MRIASGVIDQGFYFVAVDATDLKTREPGLTTWTVYRSRNNGTATVMTTPTISELDATNMPGVYFLLCDEDMTIDAGDETQPMLYHITHAGMAPVTREIELYRPKITAGNTLDVTATGAAGIDWANVENPTATVGLSGTTVKDATDVKTDTAAILIDTADIQPKIGTPAVDLAADIAAVKADTAATLVDTAEIGVAGAGLTAVATAASVAALPTAVQNADALLGRSIQGSANGGRTVTSALRKIRNRVGIAAGTLTVYEEDDTTPDHTAAVTTTAGDPISDVDPV